MSTITISLSGSAITGLTGNPSKVYTVSDADLQSLLNWAAASYVSVLPPTPTNQQILLAWIQGWVNATKTAVQQFETPPPTVPPVITLT